MAVMPRGAGERQELVALEARTLVDDGYGNLVSGPWAEQFRTHAAFIYLGGSETVMAARLEGKQSFAVQILSSSQARQITTDWRLVDVRRGDAYNVVEAVEDATRSHIDMLVAKGVAT